VKQFAILAMTALAMLAGCGGNSADTSAEVRAADVAARPALDAMAAETARLNAWFDRKYEERLDFSPMQKTTLGRKDDYDRIDDLSERGNDQMLAWARESVAELEASFDYALLAPEAQTSYDLWRYDLMQAEAAQPFRRRGYAFHQMGGPHTSLPQFLITQHRVDTESDIEAYISRIQEAGRALTQALDRARLAAGEGVHAPRYAYEAVIEQASAIVRGEPFPADDGADSDADPKAISPLWADVNAKIDALVENGSIGPERADALRVQARDSLNGRLAPAYRELIAWAQDELPMTDDIVTGVWKLPDGPAFYEQQLAAITTTDMKADEIHALGLMEVDRIHQEMESIREEVGFDGTLREFFAFVREDPQFYLPDTDQGRQAYLDLAREHLDAIEADLPGVFGLLPRASLEVRRVEPFRERPGQAQHYQRGTPDGSRPGIYYAHLSDMTAMPIPLMEVIAYHEGLPGHHLQISIAQELDDIPTFRRQYGSTAFIEGWGLYAEQLAKEMGAYADPYSDFGRLTSEIWRAIRLVVDTGLHAQGWTESEAVAYMIENSPISSGQIRAEIQRYIVMPGQATAYKIGMIRILSLRERARAALGEEFDIREFHDVVLGGGALPLSMLEERVDSWIAGIRSGV
jgi:uncharacterized protein (DUF885 family)